MAGPLNSLPKYVVSTSLQEPLVWQNSSLIGGNVAEAVASIKDQAGKEIQVIGSGELVQTLIRNELVDEYRLMIHPIVLGNGKRLFREGGTPARMRLVDSKTTTAGVLILTYEPMAGAAAAAIPVAATASSDR